MLFGENIAVTLTGADAIGLSVNLQPSHTVASEVVEAYLHDTYAIAADTTDQEINLGQIAIGSHLFAVSDGPLTLVLTQTTPRSIDIDGAFLIDGSFTVLKVTNSDTHDHNLMIMVAGDRL